MRGKKENLEAPFCNYKFSNKSALTVQNRLAYIAVETIAARKSPIGNKFCMCLISLTTERNY